MARMKIVPYSTLFGLVLSLALFLAVNRGGAVAAAPAALPAVQPASLLAQQALTVTQPLTGTLLTPVQAQPAGQISATTGVTGTGLLPIATPTPANQLPIVELRPDEIVTGTIVLNRSTSSIFFFLDNDLYELPANRAVGLALVRPLAGLTLFSCAAEVTDDPTCDWISYPIRRSAFYEISADATVAGQANLGLAVASAPPLGVAKIQNRTGADSTVLRGAEVLEIANTGAVELDGVDDAGGIVNLPHCLQTASQRICEWLPIPIRGGVYYALAESRGPAGINGVTVVQSRLEPLLIQKVLMTPTPTPEPQPVGIFCQTQIPSLNVRSGPGTDFLVINKLRTAEENQGRVRVVGRTESGEWLAVDPRFAPGGWIANVAQWLICDGDTNDLPVAEVADGREARPTPIPLQAEPTATTTPSEAEQTATVPESEGAVGPGPEQALLIATNSFEQPIRFTLDAALHGLPEGSPSEYDLEPGQSIRFLIRAGRVQFSASSAWRDGSGNAEFELAEGASRELFIHFLPDAPGSEKWVMLYDR